MIRIRNLSLWQGDQAILRNISLEIACGETLGLIGPSGGGKTSLARMMLGIVPRMARWSGQIVVDGFDVLRAPARRLRSFRKHDAGMIVQALADSLNPHLTVGQHLHETGQDPHRVCLNFNIPVSLLPRLPRDLSGGEIQRVLTALALAKSPRLLLLDEPSAALDPANRDWARQRFAEGAGERAQLLISHDLELVRQLADRIAVMRAGELAGIGPAHVLDAPQHQCIHKFMAPATKPAFSLPSATPRQAETGGLVTSGICHMIGGQPLLRNISLQLPAGECLAVLGPSGSGKSTLAQILAGYITQPKGRIRWQDGSRPPRVALISQHPHRAMAAHFPVSEVLAEALRLAGDRPEAARIGPLLRDIGLPDTPEFRARRTADLSGGEAQRLVIARAIALHSDILVADEPTSALDPANRDQLLGLFNRLKRECDLALVLMTHDRLAAQAVADRIGYLKDGRLHPGWPND
ncbi:ABC transporter ATP-binding protein [Paracoccus alkanivorans]|uniref:ABC transporter ATP-binding protein n=1 Tax=Paracoccus alkanivorans TaxID=2116655 RepID=A0A3M0MHP5_9RHOB|nr:ATP-binding cassette domain-containing protein [Paracoccus alkanivorans]RMC37246.1 ABC transporter ATP-binding protein [Paracoccus alkanivorans]